MRNRALKFRVCGEIKANEFQNKEIQEKKQGRIKQKIETS